MMRLSLSRSPFGLLIVVVVQSVCCAFFGYDILSSVFLLPAHPMSWEFREILDVGATLGLLAGFGLGANALLLVVQQRNLAETKLRRASTAFHDLLQERFGEWDQTPAERDVALFALKGLSIAQIAALRTTTEGTVKTQTNAIYRKAGVTGRPQFLSLFIEDLMVHGGDDDRQLSD